MPELHVGLSVVSRCFYQKVELAGNGFMTVSVHLFQYGACFTGLVHARIFESVASVVVTMSVCEFKPKFSLLQCLLHDW